MGLRPWSKASGHIATGALSASDFDIVMCSESVATNQHESITAFVQGTIAEGAPVVPISAQLKYNVDAVRASLKGTLHNACCLGVQSLRKDV